MCDGDVWNVFLFFHSFCLHFILCEKCWGNCLIKIILNWINQIVSSCHSNSVCIYKITSSTWTTRRTSHSITLSFCRALYKTSVRPILCFFCFASPFIVVITGYQFELQHFLLSDLNIAQNYYLSVDVHRYDPIDVHIVCAGRMCVHIRFRHVIKLRKSLSLIDFAS